jgi:REP element-mobilizing transposase RayT
MAHTFTQIHIHVIFVVKSRKALLDPHWKEELHRYITGIIQNNGHKLLAINGMPDHLHILFGMLPTQSFSDLMQEVKGISSKWINLNKNTTTKFEWQQGYGAFSYSRSQLPKLISYIDNQERHHQSLSFREEYICLLQRLGIDYDERCVFQELE